MLSAKRDTQVAQKFFRKAPFRILLHFHRLRISSYVYAEHHQHRQRNNIYKPLVANTNANTLNKPAFTNHNLLSRSNGSLRI